MHVRDATPADLPTITRLFNALIPTTTVGWRDDLASDEEMASWFDARRRRPPGAGGRVSDDRRAPSSATCAGPGSGPGPATARRSSSPSTSTAPSRGRAWVDAPHRTPSSGEARRRGIHVLVAAIERRERRSRSPSTSDSGSSRSAACPRSAEVRPLARPRADAADRVIVWDQGGGVGSPASTRPPDWRRWPMPPAPARRRIDAAIWGSGLDAAAERGEPGTWARTLDALDHLIDDATLRRCWSLAFVPYGLPDRAAGCAVHRQRAHPRGVPRARAASRRRAVRNGQLRQRFSVAVAASCWDSRQLGTVSGWWGCPRG